ncbi:hypothetical protein PInf_023740 [Phytophthora infestans]|nr:hypothetical protein PInf_023740 [Phytophthora infestans]
METGARVARERVAVTKYGDGGGSGGMAGDQQRRQQRWWKRVDGGEDLGGRRGAVTMTKMDVFGALLDRAAVWTALWCIGVEAHGRDISMLMGGSGLDECGERVEYGYAAAGVKQHAMYFVAASRPGFVRVAVHDGVRERNGFDTEIDVAETVASLAGSRAFALQSVVELRIERDCGGDHELGAERTKAMEVAMD